MRYVPLLENEDTLPKAWKEESERLLARLIVERDCKKRKALIEKHRAHWGELTDWLREISLNKCWYTEAPFDADYPEVDHYRPKKESLDQNGEKIHDGYWWLAFEWTNYRLSKPVPNRKKGAYFPLRVNQRAATCPDDPVNDESPLLLDPISRGDCLLLSYTEEGKPVAADDSEGWDKNRVDYSIDRYKLDYDPINQQRKTIWITARSLINEWSKYKKEENLTGSASAKALANEKLGQIIKMLGREAPYSMVAVASLHSTGDPAIQRLVMVAAQV
jgi:hypothetical protein